jgi:hypothetical protein
MSDPSTLIQNRLAVMGGWTTALANLAVQAQLAAREKPGAAAPGGLLTALDVTAPITSLTPSVDVQRFTRPSLDAEKPGTTPVPEPPAPGSLGPRPTADTALGLAAPQLGGADQPGLSQTFAYAPPGSVAADYPSLPNQPGAQLGGLPTPNRPDLSPGGVPLPVDAVDLMAPYRSAMAEGQWADVSAATSAWLGSQAPGFEAFLPYVKDAIVQGLGGEKVDYAALAPPGRSVFVAEMRGRVSGQYVGWADQVRIEAAGRGQALPPEVLEALAEQAANDESDALAMQGAAFESAAYEAEYALREMVMGAATGYYSAALSFMGVVRQSVADAETLAVDLAAMAGEAAAQFYEAELDLIEADTAKVRADVAVWKVKVGVAMADQEQAVTERRSVLLAQTVDRHAVEQADAKIMQAAQKIEQYAGLIERARFTLDGKRGALVHLQGLVAQAKNYQALASQYAHAHRQAVESAALEVKAGAENASREEAHQRGVKLAFDVDALASELHADWAKNVIAEYRAKLDQFEAEAAREAKERGVEADTRRQAVERLQAMLRFDEARREAELRRIDQDWKSRREGSEAQTVMALRDLDWVNEQQSVSREILGDGVDRLGGITAAAINAVLGYGVQVVES